MRFLGTIGREPEPARTPRPQDARRARRIAGARACRAWTEYDLAELVPRERGYYVHVETDAAFQVYLGDAFSPAGDVIADMQPLAYVISDGDVLVLERQPRTWSEIVYQRERPAP